MKTSRQLKTMIVLGAMLQTAAWAMAADQMQLFASARMIPERGAVPSVAVLMNQNAFSFITPLQWRIGSNSVENRVVLQSRDYNASMSFRAYTAKAEDGTATQTPDKDQLVNRFNSGKLLREFSCSSRLGEGQAYDIDFLVAAEARAVSRVVVVPVDGGWLEFNLVTSPENLDKYQATFQAWVASFAKQGS